MKKKLLMIAILIMVLCYAPNVFAENITGCETVIPGAAIDIKLANTVHYVILGIQIAVPVVLVIFGMMDLLKAITAQKEDEIKKGRDMFIKRAITAGIIFFVIAIVKLIVSFAATDSKNIISCANCFLNGAQEDGTCKN